MSTPLIRVEDVTFSYAGDPPVRALSGVSLALLPEELVALVGPNGSGKTTLARHLNGLLKPDSGRVLVGSTETRNAPVGELARQVGYVFQNPDHQLFLPSVRREVAYGPERMGLTDPMLAAHVDTILDRFELRAVADQHPAMLGRGLRRLTALAAVAALGPRVLVLDEPTGALDRRLTDRLMSLLRHLAADGHAVVIITHDMTLVAEHATRVVALCSGAVVADESPGPFFDRCDLEERTGLEAPDAALLAADLRPFGMPGGVATVPAFSDAYVRLLKRLS